MNINRRRLAVIVVGIIVVLVLAFVAFQFFMYQRAVGNLPMEGSVVTFVELGVGESYTFSDNALERVVNVARSDGALITERVPGLVDGEEVVLISIPGIQGMTMGVVHADSSISALVGDPTNKASLAVGKNGIAVFSASPAPLLEQATVPASGEEPAESSLPDVVGTATGPVNTDATFDAAAGFPQLVAVTLTTGTISSLGTGYAPRILADGSVLAVATDGIVLINPSTRARRLLMERPMKAFPRAAISPSGTVVAIPAFDGTSIDFYRLTPGTTNPPQQIGMLDARGTVGFTDDEHFFLRNALDVARYYIVPTDTLPIADPVAIIRITQ